MIVHANEIKFDNSRNDYYEDVNYDLDIPDEKIIKAITTKNPICWYALIDGALFKSDYGKGLDKIFFDSRKDLEDAIKNGLYWKRRIIPRIGEGVGYDIDSFYRDLKKSHKIEFKQLTF